MTPPRVWCVGAGAVGGNVAARLTRAGRAPLVVDADPETVARLRDPGLTVEHDGAHDRVVLDAATPHDALARGEQCDVLVLAVRWQVTEDALRPLLPCLAATGDVVSLQNGLSCERVAEVAGAARTVGVAVGFGATWLGPGRVRLDAEGGLTIGRLPAAPAGDPGEDAGLARAAGVLGDAFAVTVTGDVLGALWAKMLVNSVTVLGAVGGMLFGDVLAPGHRPLVRAVLAEGAAVASAAGVLPDVFGVPAGTVTAREPGWEAALDRALDAAARRFGAIRSVTWRDLELGRPTEVDAVTGEIVRRGRTLGIAVPASAAVLDALRAVEAGAARPGAANLAALVAAVG